jgi:hypothetical protein
LHLYTTEIDLHGSDDAGHGWLYRNGSHPRWARDNRYSNSGVIRKQRSSASLQSPRSRNEMPSVLSLKCDCGVRLSIVNEKTSGAQSKTTLPCPTPGCKAKHLVDGNVLKVFIVDDDGQSTPCDWKVVQQPRGVD